MRKLRTKAVLAAFLLGPMPAAGQPSKSVPQDPYRLAGYVPAGFSGFGTWTARKETTLYEAPGSQRVLGTIAKCQEVTAQDGEIRGHPWEMRVLKAHHPFRKGERLWILARDLEEGYFQLWYRGRVRDDVADALQDTPPFAQEQCSKPSPKCWLWVDKAPRQEHWVQMRRKDGMIGWTDRARDFGEGFAKAWQCS